LETLALRATEGKLTADLEAVKARVFEYPNVWRMLDSERSTRAPGPVRAVSLAATFAS
jgi:hypothetical protein